MFRSNKLWRSWLFSCSLTFILSFTLLANPEQAHAVSRSLLTHAQYVIKVDGFAGRRCLSSHGGIMKDVIDQRIATRLVSKQFPQWAHLDIRPVALGGWDNKTFHLGKDMTLRFPNAAAYAGQVTKEQKWLPRMASSLPLQIPKALALGEPGYGYSWHWSVYNWINGDTAAASRSIDKNTLAVDLSRFLTALYKIDITDGPKAGEHNFYRGGNLLVYENETLGALKSLKSKLDANLCRRIWDAGAGTNWNHNHVWVHGDISPGNLIIFGGRLSAVIDFGLLSVGDPSCDLAIAWTYFDRDSRKYFREGLPIDDDAWKRGRSWALWKALILAAEIASSNPVETALSKRVINEIIEDYGRNK